MKSRFLLGFLSLSVAMLAACGDDVTNVTELASSGSNISVLEKGKKLSKQVCDSDSEGKMLYVVDSSATFFCDGDDWLVMNGDGNSKVDTLVVNVKDTVVLNHVDTVYVRDTVEGLNGKDGSSCTAKEIKGGYKIVCGGDSVGVVKNGEKGKQGDQGDDGKSAYELAVENGFEGSEEKWLESLKAEAVYGQFVDERDGQFYRTVKIGTQTWMAQNLNYGDSAQTPTLAGTTWCGGGESDTENEGDCAVYGRLYTWAAAKDACPSGWRLPDTTEWKVLFDAVGGKANAGTMLKSASGWNDYEGESGNGLDAYGFSALPAGYRSFTGFFNFVGDYAYFWSSGEVIEGCACLMSLYYDYAYARLVCNRVYFAYSVRCLKD